MDLSTLRSGTRSARLTVGHAGAVDWMNAADQHGILNLTDLREAGLEHRDVVRLARHGELTRLARGWYAVGPIHEERERHVLATRAALRSHGGRAVAGHHSALLLMGLPTYQADLTAVRLSRRTPGPTSTTPTLRLGRCVPLGVQLADTVTAALAAVQHGLSVGPLSSLVAADGALHHGLATPADLRSAVDLVTGHPHSAGIADLLRNADGRHESPGETRLAHALRLMGLRAPPRWPYRAPLRSSTSCSTRRQWSSSSMDASSTAAMRTSRTRLDGVARARRSSGRRSAARIGSANWGTRSCGSPGVTWTHLASSPRGSFGRSSALAGSAPDRRRGARLPSGRRCPSPRNR
jgi:hypothetical protein